MSIRGNGHLFVSWKVVATALLALARPAAAEVDSLGRFTTSVRIEVPQFFEITPQLLSLINTRPEFQEQFRHWLGTPGLPKRCHRRHIAAPRDPRSGESDSIVVSFRQRQPNRKLSFDTVTGTVWAQP